MATTDDNATKRQLIGKANYTIVLIVSIACFVTIFSLVASKSLLSQRSYQAKVISKKETAKKQLQANIKSRDQLVAQYKLFVGSTNNVIGGLSAGTGDRDGDNAKITLDALPSKYDYPALATSLDKLVKSNNLTIASISGTDDELNQAAASNSGPVEMPFIVSYGGSALNSQNLLTTLQRSIRPIVVQKMTISGDQTNLNTTINAKTYYQPETALSIKNEVVK